MASTLTSLHIHYVFSTKKREKLIDDRMKDRLWAYMGGIARKNNITAQAVGGTSDHVHLLVTIPPTLSISKAIQLIKAGSSKWIREEFDDKSGFSWQRGYGAFSVSRGKFHQIIDYIRLQEEHHQSKEFEEEFIQFLQACDIEYDEKYVFG